MDPAAYGVPFPAFSSNSPLVLRVGLSEDERPSDDSTYAFLPTSFIAVPFLTQILLTDRVDIFLPPMPAISFHLCVVALESSVAFNSPAASPQGGFPRRPGPRRPPLFTYHPDFSSLFHSPPLTLSFLRPRLRQRIFLGTIGSQSALPFPFRNMGLRRALQVLTGACEPAIGATLWRRAPFQTLSSRVYSFLPSPDFCCEFPLSVGGRRARKLPTWRLSSRIFLP